MRHRTPAEVAHRLRLPEVLLRRAGLALLAGATAAAVLLWCLRPIPAGAAYDLGVQVSGSLLLIWLVWTAGSAAVHRLGVLLAASAVGVVGGLVRALTLDPGAEVVGTYRTLFEALDAGRNPYTCGCVLHVTDGGVRFGDFNYPPMELWPYRALEAVTGHWDVAVIAGATAALSAAGVALLFLAVPRDEATWLLPFMPLAVLWELRATVGMTMLLLGAVAAVLMLQARHPAGWHGWAVRGLFGIALLTKFAALPVFAGWWWWTAVHRTRGARDAGRRARVSALRASAADLLLPLGVAWALLLPFGVSAVLRSTILFNGDLDRREELTTFYPNVVSGLMRVAGWDAVYPLVAVALVAAAVLIAPRLRLLEAMLLTLTVFLVAAPTPEPQFMPVALLLLLAALAERDLLGRPVRWPEPRPRNVRQPVG
ncbi:MAG: hypothetical protein U0237_02115 [Thermoleophilia bacterium]